MQRSVLNVLPPGVVGAIGAFHPPLLLTTGSIYFDRNVMGAAMSECGLILEFACDAHQGDPVLIWAAIRNDAGALFYAPTYTDEMAMVAVTRDGMVLQRIEEDGRLTRDLTLAAVRQSGLALEYAGPFRADPGVALAAVQQDYRVICFAHYQDEEIALTAVVGHPRALDLIVNQTRRVALAAVRANADAMEYLKDEFVDNLEINLTALHSRRGRYHVTPSMLSSVTFMREYIALYPGALGHEAISEEVRDDELVTTSAIRYHGYHLRHASERIRGLKRVALLAIETYPRSFMFVSDVLRQDRDVSLAAVSRDGLMLEFSGFRADREVCEAALRQNPRALRFVSPAVGTLTVDGRSYTTV